MRKTSSVASDHRRGMRRKRIVLKDTNINPLGAVCTGFATSVRQRAGDWREHGTEAMFLTSDEVFRLTKRKRYTAQRRALDAAGIRYVKAADGEPLVRRDALTPEVDRKPRLALNRGPRWDRMAG